jgi:hypothetical protein
VGGGRGGGAGSVGGALIFTLSLFFGGGGAPKLFFGGMKRIGHPGFYVEARPPYPAIPPPHLEVLSPPLFR